MHPKKFLTANSLVFLSFCLLAEPSALAGTAVATPENCPSLIVGTRPESITRGFGGDLFITVMGGTEPGDGVVKRIRDEEIISIFATGMDEPKGIAYVGDCLVASDLDRLVRIDEDGKATVLADKDQFPNPVLYLNDVAAAPDGKGVYVTDMGDRTGMWQSDGVFSDFDSVDAKAMRAVGRVYHVSLEGKVTEVIPASRKMINPNGVGVGNNGQLLVGAFFNGYLLEWRGRELHIVAEGMRGADAVEQDSNGNYYVSSWNQGKVWKISPNGDSRLIADGFQRAADFHLDEDRGVLFLPDMAAGRLYVIKL